MAASTSVFEEDGTTLLTFADGRTIRAPSALLYDASGNPLVTAPSDTQAPAGVLGAAPLLWNDAISQYERARSNVSGTLLASAARTANTLSANQVNYNHEAVQLYLNVTAASGTGGLTLRFRPQDPVTGQDLGIAMNGSAITATGLYVFTVHPAMSATSTSVLVNLQNVIPRIWTAQVTVGDASSYTYSLTFCYCGGG